MTTVTVILYVYEDEIKQYAIDELNEHLKTDVDVQNIELSFFHEFPYASIEFQRVFIPDAYPKIESEDTLFYADRMFFNFNIMDIYSGDYKVKRMSVHQGKLDLKTSAEGETNYDIIERRKDKKSKSKNFQFLLELLSVDQIDFNYSNLSTNQFYDIDIEQALIQGDFSNDEYELESSGDLFINGLKSNSFTMVKDKEASLSLKLLVNTKKKSYKFKQGDLTIEEMPFKVGGEIDSSLIDLEVRGEQIKIEQLANSLVDDSFDKVRSYEGEGVINFMATIKGEKSSKIMPSIEADFNIENGAIVEPSNQLRIHNISFIGHYQNEQKNRLEELDLDNLKLKLLNSFFNGELEITNFAQPIVNSKMEGDLDLSAFHQFFKFDKIEKLAGKLVFNLDAEMQFFDPEFRKERFEIIKSDGRFKLNKISYKAIDQDLAYNEISGDVILNGKDAAVQDVKVKTNLTDILVNGAMKNFVPFIEGSGNLGLIASIESDKISLDEFLGEPNKNKDGPLDMFELPPNLNLNVDLDVKELNWENHNFKTIKGKLLLANRKITLNNLFFKTLEGSVKGKLILTNLLEQGNVIDGKLKFNNINVKTLFAEWDNFKQKSITDKHLSGLSNGEVEMLLFFNPYFSLIEDKLYASCDLNIQKGELNDLETMKSITDYMRSNKGLKLMLNKHIDKFEEKLLHLKFSDIDNQILIKDRKISIPKMTIKTNAVDVSLFGWHDFDNNVDYHFSFRFRDLKTTPEDTEFGKVEDDGLGIVVYISMKGNIEDPVFSLDKEERKNKIQENIAEEKVAIKSILKSEFGLFKKDTTVEKMQKQNKNEVEFIYYNEDTITKDTLIEDKKNKKRSNKLFDKWRQEADDKKDKIEYETEKIE
jgi:hypothetical protein